MKHSLLPINQALQSQETWDETAILARGVSAVRAGASDMAMGLSAAPRCLKAASARSVARSR